jgi:signal transduction histidine kinase
VWLVAASYQLAATRSALAEQAVAHERARVNHLVRETLEHELTDLSRAAREAQRSMAADDSAAARTALRKAGRVSRRTLASARRIVSAERGRDTEATADVRVPDTPIMAGIPRARVMVPFVIVHLTVLGFVLVWIVGLTDTVPDPRSTTAALAGWLVIAVVQVGVSTAMARGAVWPWRLPTWIVVVGTCAMLVLLAGEQTYPAWWIAATTAVGLWGWNRTAICLAGLGVVPMFVITLSQVAERWESVSASELVLRLIWYTSYTGTIAVLTVAGLVGVSQLVRRVDELTEVLSRSAAAAVDAERLRASRDVHDLLSQNFSAIALKSDLADRLLVQGELAGARQQISEVVDLASEQEERLRQAQEGFADTTVMHELATATAILRVAGVEVSNDIGPDLSSFEPRIETVLGRVVRETTTNVLRHARARWVDIRLVEEGADILLEIRNDGALAPGRWGSGLNGLAEAVGGIGGRFTAVPGPGATFVVTVRVVHVPVTNVPAAARTESSGEGRGARAD